MRLLLLLGLTTCAALAPTNVFDGILSRVALSCSEGSFVELICSTSRHSRPKKSKNAPPSFTNELRELHARPINLKKGPRIQLTYKYERQHKQKNLEYLTFTSHLREDLLLMDDLQKITVRTTEHDYIASTSSGDNIVVKEPKFTSVVTSHDVPKKTMNAPSSTFFQKLGVTNSDGQPRPGYSSKLRQCNKFVEIVSRLVLLPTLESRRGVKVLDMGCGKGYLTFALHNHLCEKLGPQSVSSVGVEVRPTLVDDINKIATNLGGNFETLSFAVGEIGNYDEGDTTEDGRVSALIALHACDTATDDAIYQGIKNDVDVIVLSPCCHKEVRRYMENNDIKGDNEHPYKNLLKFGVYRERMAEHLTDAMRGMLLEEAGYNVDIFEFIGGEHTAKNCMITATKKSSSSSAAASSTRGGGMEGTSRIEELRDLARLHGIERLRLADLMGVDLGVGVGTRGGIVRGRMPPK